MSFSKISALAGVVALASKAIAHGVVTGIVADGVYFEGYSPSFQFQQTPPVVVGWSTPKDLNTGFVAPDAYASSDIICHVGATPAGKSAPVKAGGTVELQWTTWPVSHHGPVIDYLANCHGDCSTVDKTTLEFFKIDGVGLLSDATIPGNWASDTLIANNNSWSVTIPSDIAPGNYVLRHEIIALHSAQNTDGAQNYPQCVNLQVTGSGTAAPSGTLGTALYKEADPGIALNIYQKLSTYVVPGPALYTGAASASQGAPAPSTTSAPVSSVPTSSVAASTTVALVATTSAVVSSAQTAVVATSTPSKSVCKAKSTTTLYTTTTAAVQTESSYEASLPTFTASSETSYEASLPTFTASSATTTETLATATVVPSSTPSTTGKDVTTMPAGTTLNDLLSWISSFFTTHSGSNYDANTVARRHARDLAARAFEKYDAIAPHPTGTRKHHHHHPHPTGVSGFPTGTPTGAFPYPVSTSEVAPEPTTVVKGVDTGDDC